MAVATTGSPNTGAPLAAEPCIGRFGYAKASSACLGVPRHNASDTSTKPAAAAQLLPARRDRYSRAWISSTNLERSGAPQHVEKGQKRKSTAGQDGAGIMRLAAIVCLSNNSTPSKGFAAQGRKRLNVNFV